jgi:Zn-dependent protease with chaperone function
MKTQCPHCSGAFKIAHEYEGKKAKCPSCHRPFVVKKEPVIVQTCDRRQPGVRNMSDAGLGRPPLSVDQLRDPLEGLARVFLILAAIPAWIVLMLWIIGGLGIPLIPIGIFALAAYLSHLFSLAYFKTFAVRVSAQQFPEIYQAAAQVSRKLYMDLPDIYIAQNSLWNAFATRLAGTRIIVLHSAAVDAILLKGHTAQLMWLIGHEMGHHAAGHIGIWAGLIRLGGWLPWFGLWYSRRGELTCDRIGLYACGSTSAAIRAMCNMTVGAQLAQRVNVKDVIRQWYEHKDELYVRYRLIYSTHPPNLLRIERLIAAAKELGFSNKGMRLKIA